jgi:hypothetical protein
VLRDATAELDVSIQQLEPVILGFFGSAEYFDHTGAAHPGPGRAVVATRSQQPGRRSSSCNPRTICIARSFGPSHSNGGDSYNQFRSPDLSPESVLKTRGQRQVFAQTVNPPFREQPIWLNAEFTALGRSQTDGSNQPVSRSSAKRTFNEVQTLRDVRPSGYGPELHSYGLAKRESS